jgi:hypothetical protein
MKKEMHTKFILKISRGVVMGDLDLGKVILKRI